MSFPMMSFSRRPLSFLWLPLALALPTVLMALPSGQDPLMNQIKAAGGKVGPYLKGLAAVLESDKKRAEADLVGKPLTTEGSGASFRIATTIQPSDIAQVFDPHIETVRKANAFVQETLQYVTTNRPYWDHVVMIYDRVEVGARAVVRANVDLAKLKLRSWYTSDWALASPLLQRWEKAADINANYGSPEARVAALRQLGPEISRALNDAFSRRLQEFSQLHSDLRRVRTRLIQDAHRFLKFSSANGGGFSERPIAGLVETAERLGFDYMVDSHGLGRTFSKNGVDYRFPEPYVYLDLEKEWKPEITDPTLQISKDQPGRLSLYGIFEERFPDMKPVNWEIEPWKPEEAPRPQPPAPPANRPETKVVYRDPLPKAIWGVIDLSVDNLPDWAPPHLLKQARDNSVGDGSRTLFVFGHGIPASGAIAFTSDDPLLEYSVLETGRQRNSSPAPRTGRSGRESLWRIGWIWATARSPIGDDEFFGSLEGILLKVTRKPGCLKGMKSFTLNGLKGSWPLTVNEARAVPMFVRPIGSTFEWSDTFYMPDRFCIEVSTNHPLPLQEIPVVIMRDDQPVQFGRDGPVLIAKQVGPKLYRTGPVETFQSNKPPRTFVPGVSYAYFHPGQTITAVVRHTIGTNRTWTAQAKVWLTTNQIGAYWKDALYTAVRYSGVPLNKNWGDVVPSEAVSFEGHPAVGGELGKKLKPTGLTVGDHAAMILMRRMFIEMLKEQLAGYEFMRSPEGLEGIFTFIASMPDEHPLAKTSIRVTTSFVNPGSGVVTPKPWTLKERAQVVRNEWQIWSKEQRDAEIKRFLQHIDEHVASLRQAHEDAEKLGETDLDELLKLTGFGFGAVEQRLLPRLMTLSNNDGTPRALWVPEIHARQHVQGLGYVAQKIKADKKLADATRQTVLAVAALFPVFMGPMVLARVGLSIALAVADVADLVLESHEQYRNYREYKFARAAADVLDGSRVTRAELEAPSLWGNLAAGVATFVGLRFDIADAAEVVAARLPARVPHLAAKLNPGDAVESFRRLPADEQADVLLAAAQASQKKAAGEALSASESKLVEFKARVQDEIETKADLPRPKKTPDGDAVPEPKPHVAHAKPADDVLIAVRGPGPDIGLPPVGATITTPKGAYKLEACVSMDSAYCGVYRVSKDGKMLDKVMKIPKLKSGPNSASQLDVLDRTVRGARALKEANLPHLKIAEDEVFRDGEWPCFLQELLEEVPGKREFYKSGGGLLEEAKQRAVLQLYEDLFTRGRNLIWYDGHLNNIYFFKEGDGPWQAGILDSDYLHRFDEPPRSAELSERLGMIENTPGFGPINIQSMVKAKKVGIDEIWEPDQAAHLYPSAEFFMEKMLEHKGLISYNRDTKQWSSAHFSLSIVEEYFPAFRDHVDFDLTRRSVDSTLANLRATFRAGLNQFSKFLRPASSRQAVAR
jgi:hypothetical protein